jgi:large subunit ribosomal protein L30
MKKIKITQVKSAIDRPKRQKDTIKALGIRKMNHSVEHDANPQILGMVKRVAHLVKVEEL